MNTALKILSAAALIAVTIAAGLYVIMTINAPQSPQEGTPPTKGKSKYLADQTGKTTVNPTNAPVDTAKTNQPIVIAPDNPLQPLYKPINQPSIIQFLRQEGKTYITMVVGKITGQASKKDWGIKGVAYFEYLYTIASEGKILKNNGVTIIEERSFGKVNENLIVSGYEIRVELPEKLITFCDFVGNLYGDGGATKDVLSSVNNAQISINKQIVDIARESGIFKDIPKLDPKQYENEIKMFATGSGNRLLEGKRVKIFFKDGSGITDIVPIDCEISDRERDLITRTNFVMDHYIFPDQKKGPGDEWDVDGSVFGGFLDPRLNGKIGGSVSIIRSPDFVDPSGKISKRLKIVSGNVQISDERNTEGITGQITGLKGICALPDDVGVITSAHLNGYADYRKVSRDHLLFEAQTTYTPKFEVRYECEVK